MLVEDSARDQALVLRALNNTKIVNEVITAPTGEEALDYLFGTGKYLDRDADVLPQFVLLDLKLPGIDGLQVLQKIRGDKRTHLLPVVIFTSSTEEEDLINGYSLGANSYVRKPVDAKQLLEATQQLGLYWLALNQVAKILIVDDQEMIRDGVKRILEEQPGATTFGEASNGHEALRLVREQDWHVAVVDLSLGGRSGLDLLKEIKHIRPNLPVLILSMHSEEHHARRAFKAGASGYITKDSPRAEVVKAVNKVMKGERYVSAAIAEKLVLDIAGELEHAPHEALSDREFEVMRLIASGKTVGQIAVVLSLSDRTISTYRARILEKMHMRTNAEITHYAIRNDLVD